MRLLRAESYKIRKGKSFYVSMAVIIACAFLMYGMLALAEGVMEGKIENGTGGFVVMDENSQTVQAAPGSIWDTIHIMDVIEQLFSGQFMAAVLAIYVSVVVVGDYSSGMMKNIVGKGCSRCAIFLSRIASASLACCLLTVAGLAAALLGGYLFIGKEAFTGNFWQGFFFYSGMQMVMQISLAAVFVLVCEVCRGFASGISAGIGIAVLPVLFLGLFDSLFADRGMKLSPFWMVTRGESCPMDGFQMEYFIGTIAVSAAWFLAATGIGLWHFYRTDIK